jgi:hypothetical protein
MSKIDNLIRNYENFIKLKWNKNLSPHERVIFCIYVEKQEKSLRLKIDDFMLKTKEHNHSWVQYDLTKTFSKWMSSLRYAKSYFEDPAKLSSIMKLYLKYLKDEFQKEIIEKQGKVNDNCVVALTGVGSLFGFLKVKAVVEEFAPLVEGRLLVFFPGQHENNNYRLLNGYDGWNYRAVPITDEKIF